MTAVAFLIGTPDRVCGQSLQCESNALGLEIVIQKKGYCSGDEQGGTLQLDCILRLVNKGREPLIIRNSPPVPSKP